MKRLPILVIAVLLCFIGCNSSEKKTSGKKDKYEQTKESLGETEKKNPLRFLIVTYNDKKNIFRKTVTKGEIKNNATVAIYKDVEYKIMYYSKTGTLLGESATTDHSAIEPGKSLSFKAKEWAPKDTDSVLVKIISAKSE
ncbi:MAG: hypothetical protein WCG67_00615 [Ferruginibacter sp.]